VTIRVLQHGMGRQIKTARKSIRVEEEKEE
jgi:hypothetical protein